METLLVWCLLLIKEVTCFFGWRRCHFAAVSYSFNILIFIPFLRIPFRSIPGPFRFQFRNDSIPPELGDSGMLNLAEVPAKFNSCGFHRNPQEWPDSVRNLWGCWGRVRTSPNA